MAGPEPKTEEDWRQAQAHVTRRAALVVDEWRRDKLKLTRRMIQLDKAVADMDKVEAELAT